jgi:2-hydroxychromene-2-carboxylate isomerase
VSLPAAFYFDLASPLAYLAAERILYTLPGPAEWQPVLAAELRAPKTKSLAAEDPDAFGREHVSEVFRTEIAQRVDELKLQPLRWPEPFPYDSALAMRVATYAKSIGRTVPFAQAAFRQAFAGGRDLSQLDNVLIAAAACEMHPSAVARGAELRGVTEQLTAATNDATKHGIKNVPAIVFGEHIFEGERCVEQAAATMSRKSIGAAR